MSTSSGSELGAFWGAIRHGFIKLYIHIPSDPFIPLQEIYCMACMVTKELFVVMVRS